MRLFGVKPRERTIVIVMKSGTKLCMLDYDPPKTMECWASYLKGELGAANMIVSHGPQGVQGIFLFSEIAAMYEGVA